MAERVLFLDLVVIVAAAAFVAVAGRAVRLPSIPGYLIIGAIIGPGAAGIVRDPETVGAVSRIAVILLLFTIGLQLDLSGLRRGFTPVLAVGVIGTLLAAVAITPAAWLMGLSLPAAIAVGMAMAMCSTSAVLKLIQERRELNRPYARLVTASALMQDLLYIGFLAMIPPLQAWAGAGMTGVVGDVMGQPTALPEPWTLIKGAVVGLGGIAVMVVAGKVFLPRLLQATVRTASTEALTIVATAVALSAAVATGALGFSAELGAFLAGFMLAATPFRYQIVGQLVSMRDLFMAVFFTTVGLTVSPEVAVKYWYIVLAGLALLLVGKTAINGFCAWAAGTPGAVAVLTGFALANAGEFSIVLLNTAAEGGLLTGEQKSIVVAIAAASLVLAPMMLTRGRDVAERFAYVSAPPWVVRRALLPDPPSLGGEAGPPVHAPIPPVRTAPLPDGARPRRVIIAGYGVVGRALADHFTVAGVPFTVIELNPATVRKQSRLGRSIVYGDVSNREVLESAAIHAADAILLTIPDEEALFRATPVIRSLAPHIFIAARTSYLSQAMVLSGLGADLVTVEEVATAEAMAKQVLGRLAARAREQAPAGPT